MNKRLLEHATLDCRYCVVTPKITLRKTKKYLEFIRSVAVAGVFLAIPVGFMFLFSYCAVNHVPVPLSIAELPTLLVAVMAVGTAYTLAICGIVFMPRLASAHMFGKTFAYMFGAKRQKEPARQSCPISERTATKKGIVLKRRQRKNRGVFICTIAIPLVILFGILSELAFAPKEYFVCKMGAVATGLIGAWVLIGVSVYRYFPNRNKLDIHTTVWGSLVLLEYWLVLASIVIGKGLSAIGAKWPIWLGITIGVAAGLGILFLMYVMVVPRRAESSPPTAFWITVVALVVLLPALSGPISADICGVALRVMRIGGGYEAVYILKKNTINEIPKQLLNGNGHGRTKMVRVILDVGDQIYLEVTDNKHSRVFSIPREAVVAEIM